LHAVARDQKEGSKDFIRSQGAWRTVALEKRGKTAKLSISSECTVHSRFFESRLFEIPFSPCQCAVVNVVSTLGTEFSWRAYLCVHRFISGTAVPDLAPFLVYSYTLDERESFDFFTV
jgi:hypothetical protein